MNKSFYADVKKNFALDAVMTKITCLQVVIKLLNGLKRKALIRVIYNGLKPTVKFVQDAKTLSTRTKVASTWCANVAGNSAGSVLVNGKLMGVLQVDSTLATSTRRFKKLIKIYKKLNKVLLMQSKKWLDTNSTLRGFRTIVLPMIWLINK